MRLLKSFAIDHGRGTTERDYIDAALTLDLPHAIMCIPGDNVVLPLRTVEIYIPSNTMTRIENEITQRRKGNE